MPRVNMQDIPKDVLSRVYKEMAYQPFHVRPFIPIFTKDYEELPELKGMFAKGERVVVKGRTFKVVYLSNESVTLEPVSLEIKGVESEKGE